MFFTEILCATNDEEQNFYLCPGTINVRTHRAKLAERFLNKEGIDLRSTPCVVLVVAKNLKDAKFLFWNGHGLMEMEFSKTNGKFPPFPANPDKHLCLKILKQDMLDYLEKQDNDSK